MCFSSFFGYFKIYIEFPIRNERKNEKKKKDCNIFQISIELVLKRKKSKQTSAARPADEAAWPGTCHKQTFLQALETQSQNSLSDRKLTLR